MLQKFTRNLVYTNPKVVFFTLERIHKKNLHFLPKRLPVTQINSIIKTTFTCLQLTTQFKQHDNTNEHKKDDSIGTDFGI